jgi:hypothetical protein
MLFPKENIIMIVYGGQIPPPSVRKAPRVYPKPKGPNLLRLGT